MTDVLILSAVHRVVDKSTKELQKIDLELSTLAELTLETAIKKAGLESKRIESVIWGGIPLQKGLDIPLTQVSRQGLSGLQAVFFASQAIVSGDIQVAAAGGGGRFIPDESYYDSIIQQLLGSGHTNTDEVTHSKNNIQPAAGTAALVLASPAIVGSLNLSPCARIASLAQTRSGTGRMRETVEYTLEKALNKAGCTLQDIAVFAMDAIWRGVISSWLRTSGIEAEKIFQDQEDARLLHFGDAHGVILLSQLINSLEQRNEKWGLILRVGMDFSLMAAVVERV